MSFVEWIQRHKDHLNSSLIPDLFVTSCQLNDHRTNRHSTNRAWSNLPFDFGGEPLRQFVKRACILPFYLTASSQVVCQVLKLLRFLLQLQVQHLQLVQQLTTHLLGRERESGREVGEREREGGGEKESVRAGERKKEGSGEIYRGMPPFCLLSLNSD